MVIISHLTARQEISFPPNETEFLLTSTKAEPANRFRRKIYIKEAENKNELLIDWIIDLSH